MSRAIKRIVKSLIIYIVISMILLADISYGYSQEEVGDAIAGYASHVASTYKSKVKYSQGQRTLNPIWSSDYDWETSSEYYFDCSSFASGCYHAVTGLFTEAQCTGTLGNYSSGDWEKNSVSSKSDLKIGDLLFWDSGGTEGHALIYVGDEYGEGGDLCEVGGASGNIGFRSADGYLGTHTFYTVRVSKEGAEKLSSLDTSFASGKISGSSASGSVTGSGVDYSNFYFNGIPDGKYSIASKKNIFEMIIDTLSSLLDFLAGLITYLFRGVIISFISVFDRLINNTVAAMNGKKQSLKEAGISANDADDPMKMNRSVTIEGLIFGDKDMDLFDIDIFRLD